MDRHGVLLRRELRRPHEAGQDRGGIHCNHREGATTRIGLLALGQEAAPGCEGYVEVLPLLGKRKRAFRACIEVLTHLQLPMCSWAPMAKLNSQISESRASSQQP